MLTTTGGKSDEESSIVLPEADRGEGATLSCVNLNVRGSQGTPANIIKLALRIAKKLDPKDEDVQRLMATIDNRKSRKHDAKERKKAKKLAKRAQQD